MVVCILHFNCILNYTAICVLEVIIQALDLSILTLPAFLSITAVASTQYWISKSHLEDQELSFFLSIGQKLCHWTSQKHVVTAMHVLVDDVNGHLLQDNFAIGRNAKRTELHGL